MGSRRTLEKRIHAFRPKGAHSVSKQTYLFLLLASHPQWERSRQEQDQHPVDDQPSTHELADLPTDGQRFLSVDQCGEERHHRKIHEAERKEDHKQELAATDAVGSVF